MNTRYEVVVAERKYRHSWAERAARGGGEEEEEEEEDYIGDWPGPAKRRLYFTQITTAGVRLRTFAKSSAACGGAGAGRATNKGPRRACKLLKTIGSGRVEWHPYATAHETRRESTRKALARASDNDGPAAALKIEPRIAGDPADGAMRYVAVRGGVGGGGGGVRGEEGSECEAKTTSSWTMGMRMRIANREYECQQQQQLYTIVSVAVRTINRGGARCSLVVIFVPGSCGAARYHSAHDDGGGGKSGGGGGGGGGAAATAAAAAAALSCVRLLFRARLC
ncbi:hypothetical protein V9T40_000185 [Parthenolecanium corni]|uniref:Uncharacterized protein n=1 Tax=Parthenolecanium corni TaxID=536013 RepID=A0AAN9TPY9_9HEMI